MQKLKRVLLGFFSVPDINTSKKNRIKSIKKITDWENIFDQKQSGTEIILFKTSHRCMISFAAKKEFKKWVEDLPENFELDIYEIDVINQRAVSNRISEDTNVFHQSPQIIWLNKDKTIKFHFSHGEINRRTLNNYIQ